MTVAFVAALGAGEAGLVALLGGPERFRPMAGPVVAVGFGFGLAGLSVSYAGASDATAFAAAVVGAAGLGLVGHRMGR